MNKNSLIYVPGHTGMVGSAIIRELQKQGYMNILTATRHDVDLLNQNQVFEFFKDHTPEYVFLAAARVGGIVGNATSPASFIYENMVIETNIIHAAHMYSVKKLLFLGSSCIYPKFAKQPITESELLTGPLEPTNEYYAIAKIAGLKLCEAYRKQHNDNFISLMPTNLYGPGDNYHLQNSHVLPAMIRKFHEAKSGNLPSVTVWGTGSPKREFLHVDDLANACIYLMLHYNDQEHVNVGTGEDIRIKEVAELVQEIIGYKGTIIFDTSKPDGTPRKLLNVTKLHSLGWKHTIEIREGIKKTYASFLDELEKGILREQ